MKTVFVPDNWNGSILMDCFPIIRPANEDISIGLEVEILVKDKFAGYAKIVDGKNLPWQAITEGMSYLIISHNSLYLKKTLAQVFGFSEANKPHPDFPIFFGFAQWKERHMPQHVIMFNKWYKKVGEKTTKIYQDEMSQEKLLFAE
ncbi:MAG: hypothetical protein M0Q26_13955 [Chitinophagaceae bacterium]|nr:hypothetical protein [Chitinophagaceae bacterium]MDP1763453.1 hypothetical protein [Sediminibacterium sp.]